jgi:hypothetical protein
MLGYNICCQGPFLKEIIQRLMMLRCNAKFAIQSVFPQNRGYVGIFLGGGGGGIPMSSILI